MPDTIVIIMNYGEIVHFEIPAKKLEKLSKFYSKCFGWRFEVNNSAGMEYWLFYTNPRSKTAFAGGMYRTKDTKQKPRNYISVANIDTSMKQVKKSGGKIVVGKQEIPGMGYSAICVDPEGNQFGLFQIKKRK